MRKIIVLLVIAAFPLGILRLIYSTTYNRYVNGTSWSYSEERDKMFPELGLFKLSTTDEKHSGSIEISCDTRIKGQRNFKLVWSDIRIESSYPTTLNIVLDSDPPITKKYGTQYVIDERLRYTTVAMLSSNLSLGNPDIYFEGKNAYQFLDLLKGKTLFAIKKDAAYNEFNITGLDNDITKLSAHCPREVEKKAKKAASSE